MLKIKFLKSKNIFKISYLLLFLGFALKISRVLAQDNAGIASQNFKETADNLVNNVLTSAGTLLMTAAFILFFYGVVMFIYGRVTNKGDLKELEKGKQFMLWGLIALFVMVSAWGIIKLAQDLLDVKGSDIQIQPVQFAPLQTSSGEQETKTTGGILAGVGSVIGNNNSLNNVGAGSNGSSNTTNSNVFTNQILYPIIKEGMNINDNKAAFTLLRSLLLAHKCIVDHQFGTTYDSTDSIYVKDFQKANGLIQDGIVGPKTWEYLESVGGKTLYSGVIVKDCQ